MSSFRGQILKCLFVRTLQFKAHAYRISNIWQIEVCHPILQWRKRDMEREITCRSNLLAKMGQAWDLSPDLLPSLPSTLPEWKQRRAF